MSSGVALRLRTLQRHLGSPEVWTQGSFPVPLVAQGRGMEPGSSLLTTHVLDTASGLPAEGLCLRLSRLEDHGQQWTELRKSADACEHGCRCQGLRGSRGPQSLHWCCWKQATTRTAIWVQLLNQKATRSILNKKYTL
ncbi:uncharacterized protein LOC114884496 isoform X4 [Monodon monoceros]|uniref:uncharacterized protein LOC114884496 isoform X4 n=1 Tax=Monodon monoceros TaxID=40151 RepID=UPI0010F59F26|nr:uncharacterized protein LOC114884496 isoform X4 [Monodon monoceros]